MKTKLITLAVLLLFSAANFYAHAQGVIVPNGIYTGTGGLPGYEVDVLQHPSNGNFTGFSLIPINTTTFSFTKYADEGVRVFFVSNLNPISLPAIQTQGYVELGSAPSHTITIGISFYVGLYTGENIGNTPPLGTYNNPLFGWARLINNNGVINLLDGALEYGGGGIYAGTQTIIPVPEPSSLGLLALGGLFLGWCRWREGASLGR